MGAISNANRQGSAWHDLSSLAAYFSTAIESTWSLTSRLVSWTRWSAAPISQPSWTLYRSTALLIFVITALRVSKGWWFGNGVYLRRRVLLLTQIRTYVLQWEARCLEEVEECCADVDGEATSVLAAFMGSNAAAALVERWKVPSPMLPVAESSLCSRTGAAFHGIASSMAFSTDLPLEEMLELAYMAPYVLHLHDDRLWLQRFVRLVQYILLRRVSLMEEARLYARLYRRVLFPKAHLRDASQRREEQGRVSFLVWAKASRLGAWRLHRRPTWLVPLAVAEPCSSSSSTVSFPYLCLPLGYFPIESVLPYTAAESWLSDRLLSPLLTEWRKGCRCTLSDWSASTCFATTANEEGRYRLAASKISYWFLRYTDPLLHTQMALHRDAARRFYIKRLYLLAYRGDEGESAGRVTPRPLSGGWGSLRLLFHCAIDECVWKRRQNGKRMAGTPGFPSAADAPALSVKAGRLVRRALLLRAFTQSVSITLQVCCPRLSLRRLTEITAAGYCLIAATPEAGASSSSTLDALLRSLVARMVWTAAVGVTEVFLQRWIGSIGLQLSEAVAADITAALQQNLLHADESFFCRWLRGASLEGSGTPSPLPQEPRVGSAGSYLVRRPLSADDVLSVGRRSGEKVIAVHDAVVKRWQHCIALGLRAAITREWRPLLGAVATAWVDVPKLTSAFSVFVCYSLPQDVARLLSRRDESLPSRCPTGLRLLLELLVEDAEAQERTRPASRGAVFPWLTRGGSARFAFLPHPHLALVVCANVWSFDSLLGEPQRSSEALFRLVKGVRRLYTTVASLSFTFNAAVKCPPRAQHTVASMQDDVRCIAYYNLHQIEQVCHARLSASVAVSGSAAAGALHPLLDVEETQMLQTPSAAAYLPDHVDYFDLFSLPYRFILRQLGLEMVFAYRASTGMQQESRQVAEEWWTLTLFNSAFNPLTSVLQEAVQLVAACGTVLLLCTTRDQEGGLALAPTTLVHVLEASHIIQTYRDVLRSGVALRLLEDNVCPAQQLCEWLPRTIWSEYSALQAAADDRDAADDAQEEPHNASSLHTGGSMQCDLSALQLRRRLWRRHLARQRPELLFDHGDRVISGLRLRKTVAWHHVFFAYPQLYGAAAHHKGVRDGARAAVRATLTDLTFSCPSTGMTAVIGPSGAGKSSLSLLLRRLYDPVPVIQQLQANSSKVKVSLDNVGLLAEPDDVLQEVLRLALIENALPPPPPAPLSLPPSVAITSAEALPPSTLQSSHGLSLCPGYLALDEIPLCLFSASYIRQWLAWLPQTPTVLPQQSFLQNVCLMSPFVLQEDAQRAMQLCGCRDFVEDRCRTMHDRVGPLSGGEGQRLALARVLAGVFARRRVEILNRDCGGDEDSVGCGDAVGGIVLDEPTSHLDAVNELRLLTSLTALQGSRSAGREAEALSPPSAVGGSAPLPPLFTWVISHRMSSLRPAIFMVVVENGAVTTTGSPRDVLRSNEFAKQQWHYQRLRSASGSNVADIAENVDAGEEKHGAGA
ncbi:ABC transporter family-like protein [Leptomonas seymouri]|uniref:ABC transporter family-like protein n=1 Tax=Leptomonas seymouri TaxID=5684 RepID=A0A0N1PAR5_LEPSE|nr:ABC transporter family-like protein [Leptomonas seymouri]|eukprot:KPI83980.1 ABC transporter family-like protein [Leptomonas seymouri]